jgi:hypothetical protein
MRLQLWSYNYAPEPTGIAPVSEVWAHAMKALGNKIEDRGVSTLPGADLGPSPAALSGAPRRDPRYAAAAG